MSFKQKPRVCIILKAAKKLMKNSIKLHIWKSSVFGASAVTLQGLMMPPILTRKFEFLGCQMENSRPLTSDFLTNPNLFFLSKMAASCIRSNKSCHNVLFMSSSGLFGDTVFVYAKYNVMLRYQLALLTMVDVVRRKPTFLTL